MAKKKTEYVTRKRKGYFFCLSQDKYNMFGRGLGRGLDCGLDRGLGRGLGLLRGYTSCWIVNSSRAFVAVIRFFGSIAKSFSNNGLNRSRG